MEKTKTRVDKYRNLSTLMSAPPARLWSSSTDARCVSLTWLSASRRVVSFSFSSSKEVSSTLVSEFSAEMASVFPAETEDVARTPCQTLETF